MKALPPARSIPFFLPSQGEQLFALLDEPAPGQALREGVVLCSPAPHELKKFHWTQRQLASRLAQVGFATLRFDYFATGDSAGDGGQFDLDLCRLNIQDAISWFKASGLVRRVTVVACRLGCSLAVRALSDERVKRVVLIDPVLDGQAYLDRQRVMHQQLLEANPLEAPFASKSSNHRQLLGFPHSELLAWQTPRLTLLPARLKAKSVYLLDTQSSQELGGFAQHLRSLVDDVQLVQVPDDLRWDQLAPLQRQDFPNELIQAVVHAVRGAT